MVKNVPASAGGTRDAGLIPGLGRSPGVGNGNPFQYSCLENPLDRGAYQSIVHRVTKKSDTTEHNSIIFCFRAYLSGIFPLPVGTLFIIFFLLIILYEI